MNEKESCERSKKIDYLSFLKWSDNDTKTFSGILNNLVEKVSKQIDNIEDIVICSQEDQLFDLSSDKSPADIPKDVVTLDNAKSICSSVITDSSSIYIQSSNPSEPAVPIKSPTISSSESLDEPIDENISDTDFFRKKYSILEKLKSLEPTNPSNILKLEKLRKVIRESHEQPRHVDNCHYEAKISKPSTFALNESKAEVPTTANSVRSQVLSQSYNYMKVLDSFNTPSQNIPQFEPWDELFKTIRNKSIASSRDDSITVNLDSRLHLTTTDSENTDSRFRDGDSSSENNMLTLESTSSAYEDNIEYSRRGRKNPTNCINLVIQLNDDGRRPRNSSSQQSGRRNVKFRDERNQFCLSVPSEITNKITLKNSEANGKRSKATYKLSYPMSSDSSPTLTRRSSRPHKKKKYFGDYDNEPRSSSDETVPKVEHKDTKDFKTVIQDCRRDQTLIGNYLGERYRTPVIEVRELQPSLLTDFQRLSDVLL
ncbi:unnamed protein product [Auanema sp. JU1783]|nr:unnamed protein product [Auanema sp. JU1783]